MSPLDRRLFSNFNWNLLCITILLFAIGVLNLYSASSLQIQSGELATTPFYKKQLIWGIGGFLVMLLGLSFDYRHLKNLAFPLLIVSLILLLAVHFFGVTIYGAKRWLHLILFNVQPSELTKFSILIFTAKYLARRSGPLRLKDLLALLVLTSPLILLIVKQPDLGSGLNILLLIGGMLLFRGIDKKIIIISCIVIPLVLPLGWHILKDYQKNRIRIFLNPEQDPQGAGYNIIQSKIAIGSGQIWGKGYLRGTQSKLRFLPEKHTDFAFAVFGEEWGFVGCLVLLILYFAFLYQLIANSYEAKDGFGFFLAAGIYCYFFWQISINIMMVLGLLPVVGIPLPFLSYGGSSTLINFALLGLSLNIGMRKFIFKQ